MAQQYFAGVLRSGGTHFVGCDEVIPQALEAAETISKKEYLKRRSLGVPCWGEVRNPNPLLRLVRQLKRS